MLTAAILVAQADNKLFYVSTGVAIESEVIVKLSSSLRKLSLKIWYFWKREKLQELFS